MAPPIVLGCRVEDWKTFGFCRFKKLAVCAYKGGRICWIFARQGEAGSELDSIIGAENTCVNERKCTFQDGFRNRLNDEDRLQMLLE